MKKNKILSICTIAAALTVSTSSCYDLERYPSNQLSSDVFYQNEEQADEAMMGVYNALQNDHAFGLQFSMDCLGGIAMGYDAASYQVVQRGTYDITNSLVSNKWKYLYEGVTRSNTVIQNIDRADMSDELKAQYKGEARFLRGLFYFALADFFGGVPIYDETTDVSSEFDNMLKPRNTLAEVRQFIIDDMEAAYAVLPDEWASANYGRATKWAAKALEGKTYLFAKNYTKAAECFEAVKNSGKFELYSSYPDLFLPGGDESSEMIFAIQNMGGVGTDFGMPMCFYMGTRASFGSCWNNVMVATSFVDTYEWKDGREFDWDEVIEGFNESDEVKKNTFRATLASSELVAKPAATDKLLEMYANRDPRMAWTCILPYTSYTGWYKNAVHECTFAVAPTGISDGHHLIRVNGNYECYLFRKFVPEADMDGAINNRADTPINFPLIRYADLLLMLAECYNENGNQSGAIELINQVRARVGMPGINSGEADLAATTKDQVFKRIRHERAVELAGEGHSFSDMKRWGLLEELNGKVERSITGQRNVYTRVVQSRDYLWPIPSTEIEKNASLEQNPGWGE